MASARDFAIVSALVLALLLWLRPVVGRLGEPEVSDARGSADVKLPAGASKGGVSAAAPDADTSPAPFVNPLVSADPVSHLEEIERRILDATNEERTQRGLSSLALESTLRQTSREHNVDMLERGFFDHVNPDGASPNDRMMKTHRRLVGLTGENIWMGSGFDPTAGDELARTIVESWMASPGHRENILKPGYTHLGVGVSGAGGEVRATQNFAEVRAYATEPVPPSVDRGDPLELSPASGARGDAVKFDLWSSRRGLKVLGPFDLPSARIDADAGSYQLRFYFPEGSGEFSIYYGPLIEVRSR